MKGSVAVIANRTVPGIGRFVGSGDVLLPAISQRSGLLLSCCLVVVTRDMLLKIVPIPGTMLSTSSMYLKLFTSRLFHISLVLRMPSLAE